MCPGVKGAQTSPLLWPVYLDTRLGQQIDSLPQLKKGLITPLNATLTYCHLIGNNTAQYAPGMHQLIYLQ